MDYAPPNDDLLRVDLVVELVHCPVVLHVHRHLLCRFAVQHRERRAYVHFSIIRARPKKGANDAVLCIRPAQVVVQDREECYWVNRNRSRRASGRSRILHERMNRAPEIRRRTLVLR